jgi:hypothetical protein
MNGKIRSFGGDPSLSVMIFRQIAAAYKHQSGADILVADVVRGSQREIELGLNDGLFQLKAGPKAEYYTSLDDLDIGILSPRSP